MRESLGVKYLRLAAPILATAAFGWCLLVGWWIWTTPVTYTGLVSDPAEPDKAVRAEKYERFEDVSRLGAVPLVVPAALACLAALAAWKRRPRIVFGLGLAVLGYALISGFSIGSAYMPAGAAIVLAALGDFLSDRRR